MKYRKKPVVIEAIQYNGKNGNELKCWSGNIVRESPVLEPSKDNSDGAYVQIKTLEGVMTGINGDWIIKGVSGEFYPCKPDIFEKTYESASLPSSNVTGESEAIEMIKWIRENYEPEFGDGRHWEDILDEAETPISDKELYNLYKQSKK